MERLDDILLLLIPIGIFIAGLIPMIFDLDKGILVKMIEKRNKNGKEK